MKPVRLQFAAFGSYPGEVDVDFTVLAARGLFVVTGDTGTGKTTIFDAMSYALFGTMPLKEATEIRSHHADPGQPTWVRFTFVVDGETYVAERRPAQDRPKGRGTGMTTDQAKGSLVRILTDGATEGLAGNVSQVTEQCQALIGLTAAQLQRVMLLPQGEVTRFLLDRTTDREILLRQLFGGDVYDRVVAELEATAKQHQTEVAAVDEQLRHYLQSARTALRQLLDRLGADEPADLDVADRAGIEQYLTATMGERDALGTSAATADRAATEAEADAVRVQAEVDRFDRAATLQNQVADIDGRLPEAEAAEALAVASRIARPVVEAADAADAADHAAGVARVARDERVAGIDEIARQAGVEVDTTSPASVVEAVGRLRASVDGDQALLTQHAEATEAVAGRTAERDRNDADQRAAAGRREAADALLADLAAALAAVESRRADLAAIDTEHQRLLTIGSNLGHRTTLLGHLADAEARHREADDEHLALMERFVETEAPRLAARLVPGEACPVCGSAEHPAPASADGGEPVEYARVQEASERRDAARRAVQEVRDQVAEVTTLLGEWSDAEPERVDEVLESNRDQHRIAAEAEAEFGRLSAQQAAATDDRNAAVTDLTHLQGVRTGIDTALVGALEQERIAAAAAAAVDADELGRRTTAVARLGAALVGLDDLFTAVTATTAKAETATEQLATVLSNSGVASVDAARAALLPPEAEAQSIASAESLRAERSKASAQIEELLRQGVPTSRPDADGLVDQARERRRVADDLNARLVAVVEFADSVDRELADHDRSAAGSVDLRRRAEVARRVHLVCKGTNSSNVSLSRWVLGRELDRVTAAASVHLLRMTGSRYSIRRVLTSSDKRRSAGLDLEILDAHTGRPRKPTSLSGGEQFQTSLALALGLADVVSLGGSGSGRRMEALFIDEGFGSLDPKALDDAIETLHQLRDTGRMVGAITHVETMKERLHPGIVVTRLSDGKGSTLRVNP